jgi:hypothetical protein
VFPLDLEELDLHGRQLAWLGALLLALCRGYRFLLFFRILDGAIVVFAIPARTLVAAICLPSPEEGQAVGIAKFFDKLSV